MNDFEKAFQEVKAIIRNGETTLNPELLATCQEALRLCKEEYCNGWSNRETWLFNLWITNEEVTYRHFWEMTKDIEEMDYPIDILAEEMEKYLDWLIDHEELEGMLSDLATSTINRINFYEVAKTFLEE